MTAKSAPQLVEGQKSRNTTFQVGATLCMLAAAVLLAGAASTLVEQRGAAAVQATPVRSEVQRPQNVEAVAAQSEPVVRPENRRYRALAEFLAKRYKVSQAVTLDLVTIAHTAGRQIGLDPLLIIAVMAVESRFNPIAESVVGAKGLMQIIPKYHVDKFREFGGEQYAVFDPETNILVGARILKEYLSRTGSVDDALQMYVGASSFDDDVYTSKVMGEKERLQQVLSRPSPQRRPDVEASVVIERVKLADAR